MNLLDLELHASHFRITMPSFLPEYLFLSLNRDLLRYYKSLKMNKSSHREIDRMEALYI